MRRKIHMRTNIPDTGRTLLNRQTKGQTPDGRMDEGRKEPIHKRRWYGESSNPRVFTHPRSGEANFNGAERLLLFYRAGKAYWCESASVAGWRPCSLVHLPEGNWQHLADAVHTYICSQHPASRNPPRRCLQPNENTCARGRSTATLCVVAKSRRKPACPVAADLERFWDTVMCEQSQVKRLSTEEHLPVRRQKEGTEGQDGPWESSAG